MARKLTRKEVIEIGALLAQHLEPVEGQPGIFQYKGDWDDAAIAKVIADDIPKTAVGGLRLELYGRINKKSDAAAPDTEIEELRKVLQSVIDGVTALAKNFQEHQDKYVKLVHTLHINRVADVKHLV